MLIFLPMAGAAQVPEPASTRLGALQSLRDSAWIRVADVAHGRREARLLAQGSGEVVLDLGPRPLRIPATSIDTVWERRTASRTGALVGGLLGAGLGVLIATQTAEKGETPPADWVLVIGAGGAAGGGLLGALVGTAFPRWDRRYPAR